MGAGWLYYHKHPPKRKCPECGKPHYLKRLGGFSNGEDVWGFGVCPKTGKVPSNSSPFISWHGMDNSL